MWQPMPPAAKVEAPSQRAEAPKDATLQRAIHFSNAEAPLSDPDTWSEDNTTAKGHAVHPKTF